MIHYLDEVAYLSDEELEKLKEESPSYYNVYMSIVNYLNTLYDYYEKRYVTNS